MYSKKLTVAGFAGKISVKSARISWSSRFYALKVGFITIFRAYYNIYKRKKSKKNSFDFSQKEKYNNS